MPVCSQLYFLFMDFSIHSNFTYSIIKDRSMLVHRKLTVTSFIGWCTWSIWNDFLRKISIWKEGYSKKHLACFNWLFIMRYSSPIYTCTTNSFAIFDRRNRWMVPYPTESCSQMIQWSSILFRSNLGRTSWLKSFNCYKP